MPNLNHKPQKSEIGSHKERKIIKGLAWRKLKIGATPSSQRKPFDFRTRANEVCWIEASVWNLSNLELQTERNFVHRQFLSYGSFSAPPLKMGVTLWVAQE